MENPKIHRYLEAFTRNVDALIDSLPLVMTVAEGTRQETQNAFKEYLEAHGTKTNEDEEKTSYELSGEHDRVAARKKRNVDRVNATAKILPQSYVVSLISEYDAFLGSVLKEIYTAKPELLNSSERQLKFSELIEFGSIEEAREFVLEKEIETILRQSHADQFKALEAKFDVKLTKGLEVWPVFIELTERRNLYVHTSGVVSRQYRSVCGKHGVVLDESQELGKCLELDGKYLSKAYACIYEIGFKLANVLWMKVFPSDRENADESIIDITYELLVDNRYKLARKLLDFSLDTIKAHHDEAAKRVLMINRAIACKYSGDTAGAIAILDSVDWSALSEEYQLAVAVLHDENEKAITIMKRVGSTGKVGALQYKEWPLFRDFRLLPEFSSAYEEIFGEKFTVIEEVKSPAQTLLDRHVVSNNQVNEDAGAIAPAPVT